MSSLSNDVNSIVKIPKIKDELPALNDTQEIGSNKGGDSTVKQTNYGDIVWPAILQVTLETDEEMNARPDQGWIYQDNDDTKPGVQVKRGKSAKIIDSIENEFDFTEITFIEP